MNASGLATLTPAQKRSVASLFSGLKTSRPIVNFVRITSTALVGTPLGFGTGPSRFSAVMAPARPVPPFGLIYGASDLATACYETIIRDRFDVTPTRILRRSDYSGRSAINFSSAAGQALQLLDLTNGNATRFGVPTDVTRYSTHTDGQYFSQFVHAEMPDVDGILYASRFTESLCVAVYDRAIAKLTSTGATPSLTKTILVPTVGVWNILVV